MERTVPKTVLARITELCEQYSLPDPSSEQLSGLLLALSGEHAPTAVGDPTEGVDVHIADALSGLAVKKLATAQTIADIGSGCGIPGLVLAAALPASEVIAVEAASRRCDFIRETAADSGITNAKAVWTRVEEWGDRHAQFDVVTARAVASLPVLAEYAAPLLREGGVLVAWKGSPSAEEILACRNAALELGLGLPQIVKVKPWKGGGLRRLIVIEKLAPTPANFPRRAGIALKRPLGS